MSHLYRRPRKHGTFWLAFYKNGGLTRESLHTKDLTSAKYLQNKKDREILETKASTPNLSNSCLPMLEDYLSHNEHRRTKMVNNKNRHEVTDFLTWGGINTFKQITEKKFQDYLNHKVNNEKLQLISINRYIESVKAWLNYAVRMRYIFENPLARVKRYQIPENPKRFLSADEIKTILDASRNQDLYVDKNPTLYPAIATGIYAGPRPKELSTLDWQDIDFKHNKIMIRNKEGFTIKTKKFRIIPMHDRLKIILKPLAKKEGRCFDFTNSRRIFGRILRSAKLQKVDWYTLRHTFGSHAAMAGVPLPTLKDWMGHASITTTMIYAHLSPEHHKAEINKVF